MPTTKNLFNQQAIEKIKSLTGSGSFVMFCTNLGAKPFGAAPMAVQETDDEGNLWFFSGKDSDHNADIARDPKTQILLSDTGSSDYLSLFGTSTVVNDKAKAKELWNSFAKIWFQGGVDDPNLTLVKFTPEEGFYWDTKHGKMVAMAKMAASLITGKTMDDSVDGKLKV